MYILDANLYEPYSIRGGRMPTAPTHPTVASLLRRGDLSLRFLDTVDEEQTSEQTLGEEPIEDIEDIEDIEGPE